MEKELMNIFESEYDYEAFMLHVAYDYETVCFRKNFNKFYVVLNDEQLFFAAKAYREFLENSNSKEYNSKIKNIFKNSPVVILYDNFWEKMFETAKKCKKYELYILGILAVACAICAIFTTETLTEFIVLILCSCFLSVKPLAILIQKFRK